MPVFGESNIMECKTQASMESNVQSVLEHHKGKKILVVFDVDMVLTQPSDPAVQMGSMAKHRKYLGQLFEPLSDIEKKMALTLAAISGQPQLVSQKMPEFVQSLNAMENVYTIGLTAFTTGEFQKISSLEKWRIDVLKSFGIHLGHKDFPAEQVVLSSGCNGANSLFLEGIVFCDDVNNPQAKPDNLFAFLKHTDWVPDVIIFMDDRDKYLHAMGVTKGEVQDLTEDEVLNVFIPTTPNPTSGYLLFVPSQDIYSLDMTVEEGIKMVVSAGIVTPEHEGQ
ncbi:hypothetical protein AWC38_SpisGene25153, partial [Stylophora pistillata]